MYVAITRARRRLYLSHTQSRMLHGQVRYNLPSRFLDELPEQVLLNLNRRSESSYAPSAQQTTASYSAPRSPGHRERHRLQGGAERGPCQVWHGHHHRF